MTPSHQAGHLLPGEGTGFTLETCAAGIAEEIVFIGSDFATAEAAGFTMKSTLVPCPKGRREAMVEPGDAMARTRQSGRSN
ncbi:hypothetical protein C7I84_12770 [Mesorhizobium ephedrae]|uniref:Uncharacterized protein n=1 Tax=Kumtagia ephedrae TaxID=2116701 RepID=A0A2P7SAI5_9HYPH|nr:hypothetical protein C7I84_12770 [Mesorhizobium ephedrae]